MVARVNIRVAAGPSCAEKMKPRLRWIWIRRNERVLQPSGSRIGREPPLPLREPYVCTRHEAPERHATIPRMRARIAPLLGLALVTVLLTFPMAFRAHRAGPVNTGDGQWSIWSTCWVARTLLADPLHLYDANIFSPHRGTLAYSEANIVGGALALPGWWAARNPYLAYNTAILLSFLLASLAAFTLSRHLVAPWNPASAKGAADGFTAARNTTPAFFGAIAFAFAPLVVVRLAHVQLLMTLGLPLSLLAFHRFVERQSVGRGAGLAAALVLAALSSGYYGIAAAVAVGLGIVYYALSRALWRSPRYLAGFAAVVVLAGLLVLPFFLPYLQLETGGTAFRSVEETRRYSADWRSYLTSTAHVQRWILGWVVPFDRGAFPERVLFPGFMASLLAVGAVVAAWRQRREARGSGSRRETVGFYALLALVGAWLSFGPAAGLYALAYEFLPGFSMTRAPARLAILVVLAIAMLASIGLASAVEWWAGRSAQDARRPRLLAVAATIWLVLELAAVPLDLRPALRRPAPYQTLAVLPAGAVAEFPYFFLERDLYRNSLYMLHSTAHWHPLVNGYSDFIPPGYRETVVAISTFPSREAFRLLRERGARYAVFHPNLFDHRSREKLVERLGRYKDYVRELARDDETWLYEIVAWP